MRNFIYLYIYLQTIGSDEGRSAALIGTCLAIEVCEQSLAKSD